MANNLKAKLIRENPIVARMQERKYLRVRFIRSVNSYCNLRYPTESQLKAVSRIMDEIDASTKIPEIVTTKRREFHGTVVRIKTKPRNKGYETFLVIKGKDIRYTYVLRRTKSLVDVKLGDKVSLTAQPSSTSLGNGNYFLSLPTKCTIN